jgi:ABC-type sulfate transport system permease component
MTISDIHTFFFSFLGVMVAEVVVKPIAIRTGRYLLRKLDDRIVVIPDWLSRPKRSCEGQDEE